MTSEQEVKTLDEDVGYHAYALRDIITDFKDRFGKAALRDALAEALSPLKLEITNNAQ